MLYNECFLYFLTATFIMITRCSKSCVYTWMKVTCAFYLRCILNGTPCSIFWSYIVKNSVSKLSKKWIIATRVIPVWSCLLFTVFLYYYLSSQSFHSLNIPFFFCFSICCHLSWYPEKNFNLKMFQNFFQTTSDRYFQCQSLRLEAKKWLIYCKYDQEKSYANFS